MGSQHHNSSERNSGNENAQIRAKILSVINGIVSNRIKDGLVLDVSLRLECGLDGKQGVQWSNVQDVVHKSGPKFESEAEARGCQ